MEKNIENNLQSQFSRASANNIQTDMESNAMLAKNPPQLKLAANSNIQQSKAQVNRSRTAITPKIVQTKSPNKEKQGEENVEQPKTSLMFSDANGDLPTENGGDAQGSDGNQDGSSSGNPIQRKDDFSNNKGGNHARNGIPAEVQAKMESSLGADFSNVNIHTNSHSAKEVNALAYTQGNDVHFAPGQFNPNSQSGQQLIGHELTHVVQQRSGKVKPTTTAANGMAVNNEVSLESEADNLGAKAANSKVPIQKKESNINTGIQGGEHSMQLKSEVAQFDGEEATGVPDEAVIRSGSTTIVHENETYNLTGKYREIVNQLAAEGEDGSVSTNFDDISTSSANGTTASVSITVKIVKRMPVWTDLPQVQALANDENERYRDYYQRIVSAWTDFHTALNAHEEGHKAIDVSHFTNCHRRLIGKTIGQMDAELTAIETAATALHTAFHTEHGSQEVIRDVQRPYEVTADEADDDEDSVQFKSKSEAVTKSNATIQKQSDNSVSRHQSTPAHLNTPSQKVPSGTNSNQEVVQAFLPAIAFGVGFAIGYTGANAASSRHTDRNQLNQLPAGILRKQSDGTSGSYIYIPGGDNNYVDGADRVWALMSEGESVYHQPKEIVDGALDYQWQRLQAWWNNDNVAALPNKKFISRDDQGGSFEAVLQPNSDGTYTTNWLNSGTQQGTYNYSSPDSIGGKIGHFVDDVLPHYLNEDYSPTPGNNSDTTQQKSKSPIQLKENSPQAILQPQNMDSQSVAQFDGEANTETNVLELTFPFGISSARTNGSAALGLFQYQNFFTSLQREIDEDENYSADTAPLVTISSQLTQTIRSLSSRDAEANLEGGEILILQSFINGYEETYNEKLNGYRNFVLSRLRASQRTSELDPMTPEIAEAKRLAFENGDESQLQRIQDLIGSIKTYNEKVSTYIGYASRVSGAIRSSATLQAIQRGTGSIAEFAGKAGDVVNAMRIVANFATDSSNSELHTSINRVQSGLDAIDLAMTFFKGVPVLGALWSNYYYPAATACLQMIGRIASVRNRDRRLMTWIGSNWQSPTPPRIEGANSFGFPGGQPVFSFLWHLFFGNYHYDTAAEEYFMDHESDINAGVSRDMVVTGKWNPFEDNHITSFQSWASTNKMDLWLMFYGADLPFPGTGSVEQSMGDYNDDVAQRSVGAPIQRQNENGNTIPAAFQSNIEQEIGMNMSNVNINTNSSKASNLGALAFSQGNNIEFAPGQFNPNSNEGQHLIAHEAAHLTQKSGLKATTQVNGTPVNSDPKLESEADNIADRIVQKKNKSNGRNNMNGFKIDNDNAGTLEYNPKMQLKSKSSKHLKSHEKSFELKSDESHSPVVQNKTTKAFTIDSKAIQRKGTDGMKSSKNLKSKNENSGIDTMLPFGKNTIQQKSSSEGKTNLKPFNISSYSSEKLTSET